MMQMLGDQWSGWEKLGGQRSGEKNSQWCDDGFNDKQQ